MIAFTEWHRYYLLSDAERNKAFLQQRRKIHLMQTMGNNTYNWTTK